MAAPITCVRFSFRRLDASENDIRVSYPVLSVLETSGPRCLRGEWRDRGHAAVLEI